MSEILQLLNDFQGIIGTILGSVTTLIVTDILKKRGQLKNYLVSYEAKFQTFRDVGCSMGGKRDEDFYGYSIKYIIQIYNQSDTPKIMRDFRLIFYKNTKEQYSLIPDNEETRRYSAHISHIDEMEGKRLIFWYDKKIPDYFSVAGAPCYENKTRSKKLNLDNKCFQQL